MHPVNNKIFKVFISSSDELNPEREAAELAIHRLNREYRGVVELKIIRWEKQFYQADRSLQQQIEATSETDLFIGMVWTRIGLPISPIEVCREDGSAYESGTVFEIETALAAKKKIGAPDIYLFQKEEPIEYETSPEDLRRIAEQIELLQSLLRKWQRDKEGHFIGSSNYFTSTNQFVQDIEDCIRNWLLQECKLEPKEHVWNVVNQGSPFCGLTAFDESHQNVFFGRDSERRQALQKLMVVHNAGCGSLIVLGASGIGKSSFVRAGLVPDITQQGLISGVDLWRCCVITPTSDPFKRLTDALLQPSYSGEIAPLPELVDGDFKTKSALLTAFRSIPEVSINIFASALDRVSDLEAKRLGAKLSIHSRLLLVIDQFEELEVMMNSEAEDLKWTP